MARAVCASPASIRAHFDKSSMLWIGWVLSSHRLGRELFAEQPMASAGMPAARIAQREVDIGRVQVDPGVARASMRMSMSGCSLWNASSRGISHIEANEAQVVMATRLRPGVCAGSGAPLLSMRSSEGRTRRSSCAPGAGELHRAGVAQEQGVTPPRLRAPGSAGSPRSASAPFFGGGAEVQVPRHRLEGAQVAGGNGGGGCWGEPHGHAAGIDAVIESIA